MDIETYFQEQYDFPQYPEQMTPTYPVKEMDMTVETEDTVESPYITTKFQASNSSSLNHSKDSLKFARRIAKSILQIIQDGPKNPVQTFLDCGLAVLYSQVALLDIEIADKEKLVKTWLQAIKDVWNFFAKNLSCSYNKKISKVTKEIWDMVFTEEGFWKALKDTGNSVDFKDCLRTNGPSETMLGDKLCRKALYLINRGLALSHVFSLRLSTENFYENIPTVDNYLVLAMVPGLYDAYNHKRGVFIDQCCRSCKVCQSKSADKSVVQKIATAWDYAIAFQKTFESNWRTQSVEDPMYSLSVLRFLTVLDAPVTY